MPLFRVIRVIRKKDGHILIAKHTCFREIAHKTITV